MIWGIMEENRSIEDYSKVYVERPFEAIQVKYRLKKVLECIEANSPKTILEIGCGLNPIFTYLKPDIKTYTVEPAKMFYENACKLARTNNVVINGYFEDVVAEGKLEGIHFDYVVCSSLLHELDKPEIILNAVKSISAVDTILHVNVPNANSVHRLLAEAMGIVESRYVKSDSQIKLQQADDVYDINKLTKLVEINGFNVINKGSYFLKRLTHLQMQKCIDAGAINEKVLDGVYELSKMFPEYGSEIFVECRI